MGDNDKQNFIEQETGPKNALLDELDSLKELLREETQVNTAESGVACDSEIPLLDDVVDIDAIELEPAHQRMEPTIPVLEEVSFPPDQFPTAHAELQPEQSKDEGGTSLPSEEELSKLIDMLVGHRLRRLRPKIKEEVLDELQRLYPELFR